MHIVNPGEFVFACVYSVVAMYLLLGAFFNAPWLHTDGRRKDGQWVVARLSGYHRAAYILVCGTLGGIEFHDAFYDHTSAVEIWLDLAMVAFLALLYWLDYSSWRKNQKTA